MFDVCARRGVLGDHVSAISPGRRRAAMIYQSYVGDLPPSEKGERVVGCDRRTLAALGEYPCATELILIERMGGRWVSIDSVQIEHAGAASLLAVVAPRPATADEVQLVKQLGSDAARVEAKWISSRLH